jgi:outer membrane murein-binding lipoprotein Lpp
VGIAPGVPFRFRGAARHGLRGHDGIRLIEELSMNRYMIRAVALASTLVAGACSPSQRDTIDSATGTVDSAARAVGGEVRAEVSVLDVDIGKRAEPDNEVDDEVETFAPSDTIYASVQTTGAVRQGAIAAKWTFPDGSILDQQAQPVTGDRSTDLLFFLTKAGGLAPGKYTFRVLVDGKEVRSQDVTVNPAAGAR